jgi:hypothetical protein
MRSYELSWYAVALDKVNISKQLNVSSSKYEFTGNPRILHASPLGAGGRMNVRSSLYSQFNTSSKPVIDPWVRVLKEL